MPDPVLFYFVVAVLTRFSTTLETILEWMAVVMAAAVATRFVVSFRTLEGWPERTPSSRLSILAVAGLGLSFCLPLRGESWFASHFAVNVWNNSTFIFMAPLSIILFNLSMDYFQDPDWRTLAKLSLLAVLNVLAKPSFFLCFAVVFPGFAWYRHRQIRSILPVVAGGVALFVQFLSVYSSAGTARGAGLALSWFRVWAHFSHNIPLTIVNSLLLPLAFIAVYPKQFWQDLANRYSLALLLVGMAIYAFVQEIGSREFHGNLGWQLPVCNYLLHLTVLSTFFRLKRQDCAWSRRDGLLVFLFGLNWVCGLAYLARITLTGAWL